jgi:signal transduction histidine kinase
MSQIEITITDTIIEKWQKIVDLMATIMDVPTALIMKVDHPYIQVYKASSNPENPYNPGDKEHLAGLYCETVIKTKSKLLVPNALKDPEWKDNPDIDLGMISYLGMPLNWPNGEIFGTICILDKEENYYDNKTIDLLKQFREMAEMHLALLFKNMQLENSKEQYKKAYDQVAFLKDILIHDIKNLFQGLKLNVFLFSNEIKDEFFGDKKEIFLETLKEQINKGTRLVSNVYTFSKLDRNVQNLVKTDLIDYLESAQIEMQNRYTVKDIKIETNYKIENNAYVLANEFLEDLFNNILGNAIKHNNNEIIKVWIELSQTTFKDREYYKVEFCDNGYGIPEDIKEQILNKNEDFRHKNDKMRLGMVIIKKLVNVYGGELFIEDRIESDHTKGTCLKLLFPKISKN